MREEESNNLRLPVEARVKARIQELKRIGKPEFRKGEDGRFQDFPPEMPIKTAPYWATMVRKDGDALVVRYEVFKTKKDSDGVPQVEVFTYNSGSGLPVKEKIVDRIVSERYEKGKKAVVVEEKLPIPSLQNVEQEIITKARNDKEQSAKQ